MRLAIDIHQAPHVQMGVALGRAELRVTEQFLDHPQVRAGAQQMGGERVPQGVRTDALRIAASRV